MTKAAESHGLLKISLEILLIAGGALLALGCITTIASCLVGSIESFWAVLLAVNPVAGGSWLDPIFIAGTLATIILAGPGGFSLDAYFFGPRRIEIPIQNSSPEWRELRARQGANAWSPTP